MEIPTTHNILLLRLMMCAIVLFFDVTYAITLFIDSFFVCQTYAVILLEPCCLKRENSLLEEIVQLIFVLFAAESIIFVVVCLSFFWCSCLEAPLCTKIFMTVKHMFKGNLTFHTKLFNCFTPIIFYHVPPIFLDSESTWFGAPTSLSPTFVNDGKYVLSYKVHAMGQICKKWWLWDFLVKFSFGCIQNLTPDTYQRML